MNSRIQVGDRIPDFALPDQHGTVVSAASLLGHGPVVLFFYPRDETPGCTAEACAFRDQYEVFRAAGAQLVGISSDAPERHQRFASRHQLPFVLLSDRGGELRKRFGVPRSLGLLPGRVTYVLDREGVVQHVFESQFAAVKHVEEALRVVRALHHQEAATGGSAAPI
jgi:peroxiredoxin Q/BCP